MKSHARFFPVLAFIVTFAFSMTACDDVLSSAPTVTDVTVDGPENVYVERGGTLGFNATVAGTNDPPLYVTWSIVEANTHMETTIDRDNGLLAVAIDEGLTTLTVRATSTFNAVISGTVSVSIPVPTVTEVTVDPTHAQVARGGGQNFAATVTGTNNPPQYVTWSIVETDRHEQTTIGRYDGLLAVAVDESRTALTIRATSTFNTEANGMATVTVTAPIPPPTVTNVTVNGPENVYVEKGKTLTFTATVTGTNNPPQIVTWSIVEAGRHEQTTIGHSNGILRIAADEGLATLTVRATSTLNTAISGKVTVTVTPSTVPSLREIWAGYFPIGNIVAYRHHRRHGDIAAVPASPGVIATTAGRAYERGNLLRRHFNILTAEDEMKPDFINVNNFGQFNWTRADRIVDFAETQGMRMHGHTLVWHSQSPWWLNQVSPGGEPIDRDNAIGNLVTHIETVMRHFGDSVESWDVLNEVFGSWFGGTVTANNWRDFLRNYPSGQTGTPWRRAIGVHPHDTHDPNRYCYIWISFTTARRIADEIDVAAGRPLGTMILYYNDYNEEAPSKREAIFFMVREMNQRFAAQNNGRILIDAIGMQAHYHRGGVGGAVTDSYQWVTDVSNVRNALERFASLIGQGLLRYVSITELDITVGNTGNDQGGNVNRPAGTPLTAAQARAQAIMYAQLFQIFRNNSASIRRISFWGIDDPSSWRHRGSPHLWDGNLRPKEAFWAVADPDAFLLPNGQPHPATEIDAFLANPRHHGGSGFIPESAWD